MNIKPLNMPPITEAHLLAAFTSMKWKEWNYEAAMANDLRRRVIVIRAHQLRTSEYIDSLEIAQTGTVRRCRIDAQGNEHWVTQQLFGPRQPVPDLFNQGKTT